MSKTHVAAIDLGATSGRVIVGAFDRDGLELHEIHRFPNSFHTLNGYDYWDLGGFFDEIRRGLKEAVKRFPDLRSCGVDTWGVDHVLLNGEGRLVFPAHAYRDERTTPHVEEINNRDDARKIFDWTGIPVMSINSALQLAETIRSNPAITELAERVLFLPDYFNYLLSGTQANEFSIASTSELVDVNGESFSAEALDYFGIPARWLQGPVKAGQLLGKVRDLPGLENVEVALVPGHDTSCAYEAIPTLGHDLLVSAGTWLLVGSLTKHAALGDDAFADRIANERTGTGGYRPNRQILGLWLFEQTALHFSDRPQSGEDWEKLIAAAEALPASSVLIDTNDQALFNPSNMRDAISRQIEANGGNPPEDLPGFMRLICDSLGHSLAQVIQRFEAISGQKLEHLIIVGGGSRNRLLCQRAADYAGIPAVSFNLEGTAVGNIGYQLLALGEVKSMEEFRQVVAADLNQQRYEPAS